MSFMSTFAQKI